MGDQLMKLFTKGISFLFFCLGLAAFANAAEPVAENSCQVLPSPMLIIDGDNKSEGDASIRVDAPAPCRITIAKFSGVDFDQFRLVTSAKLKSELTRGSAVFETLVRVKDGFYFSRALDKPVKEKTDWTEVKTFFNFKKNEHPDEIFVNLIIEGSGSVWIDEIKLFKEELPLE